MTEREKTRFVHVARQGRHGRPRAVNPSVTRASTVLYDSTSHMRELMRARAQGERDFTYGAKGTPTTFALEDALTEIEGGKRTQLFPTGLAAIAHVFLSLLKPGDHLLLGDTLYNPARAIAEQYLRPRGIDAEFYPGGAAGAGEVERRLKANTKLVFLDNPGSIVFDIQDLPAITAAARKVGALVGVDNTWGAAGLYKPLALGADLSVIALTKYIAGHSDITMGSVTANERIADRLWLDSHLLGQTVSPDDAYQVLRGLRTVSARLTQQAANARVVIEWLAKRKEVARVLYPALPDDPGHALWKRDFHGTNSLFSIELASRYGNEHVAKAIDALELFGIGASWGGFESLVLTYPQGINGWSGGALIRLHIGLEDPSDVIADLERSFAAIA